MKEKNEKGGKKHKQQKKYRVYLRLNERSRITMISNDTQIQTQKGNQIC